MNSLKLLVLPVIIVLIEVAVKWTKLTLEIRKYGSRKIPAFIKKVNEKR